MNKIQRYFAYRQGLIDQYVKGDMSKSEYLEKNFEAVLALRREPFKYMDSVDKCLFNYQYYNAYAKESKMISSTVDDYDLKNVYIKQTNYYYSKKDAATLAALNLLEYSNVWAYYIKVNSKYLKGKLFEIIIDDYQMVLHSMNDTLRSKLKTEGVFIEETRISKTDAYINQKY